MVFIPIQNIGSFGVMQETPAHRLPPEAWTRALNVRFVDKRAQKIGGHANVMGTPSVAPGFIMVVDNDGDIFWLYASAVGAGSKVYAFNSGTHADISQAGDYTVVNYRSWNGDIFHGIPILNNGNSVPQYWPTPSLSDDLEDIPAWPANTTAKVVRAFDDYMVALHITDAGGSHPHRVMWSDGAAAGELPASWDVTDPTFDADHRDLTDNSGGILDGIALRDFFVIFKNESTWIMRYIGGQNIMSIRPAMRAAGLLAPRCALPISIAKNKLEAAFTMTGEDLGVFDGQDFLSVIEDTNRKFLISDIDPNNYVNSFVLDNRAQDEAWFCYPENGETNPSMACIWNYKENTITFREFIGTSAATGPVESTSSETWATVSGTWDAQGANKWQDASRRKVIISDQANTLLQQLEGADNFNGTSFSTVLERVGLAVIGTDRQGQPIVDYNKRKMITRVWPQVTGGPVLVQIGGADTPNPADVVWQDGVIFDPDDGVRFCDPAGDGAPMNAVYNAIRFSSVDDEPWMLEGYGVDVEVLSEL